MILKREKLIKENILAFPESNTKSFCKKIAVPNRNVNTSIAIFRV